MRFFTTAFVALSAVTGLVAAQAKGPNAITNPLGGTIEAGKPLKITWEPTTPGKVTLVLRKGDPNNLDTIDTIVNIENKGEFTWTPPAELEKGKDYAIEIRDADGNPNWSPQFELLSDGEGLNPTTTAVSTTTRTATTTSAEETETETDTATTTTTKATTTKTESQKPTATDDEEEEDEDEDEIPNTNNENSAGKAASPLALVFCVAMAVAYLN